MRKLLVAVVALAGMTATAAAQYGVRPGIGPYGVPYGTGSNPNSVYHQGYTTQNGTYVQPHMQTAPNSTPLDNYGTRGNVNPYTGQTGTRYPYR